jgi:hypothetical protein
VPVIRYKRFGHVGPSIEQWYPSQTVKALASAQWNGMSASVR